MSDSFIVHKQAAEEMLTALGFQGVSNYPEKKLLEKLSTLHSAKGVDKAIKEKLTGADKATAEGIVEASRADRKIEVSDEPIGEAVEEGETFSLDQDDNQPEEVEEVEATTKEPAKKPATKPAPAPKAPPAKTNPKPADKPAPAAAPPTKSAPAAKKAAAPAEPKERKRPERDPSTLDVFGSKLGSRASRINAVITEAPKKLSQIAEDAKYDKSPSNHLRWMIQNGWAELVRGEGYKLTAKALAAKGIKKGAKPAPKATAKPSTNGSAKPAAKPAAKAKPKAAATA